MVAQDTGMANMKTRNGMMSLWAILLVAVLSMSGCGGGGGGSSENKTINVTGLDLPPYYFVENGEIAGIDADIAKAALEKAGVSVKMSMSKSADEALSATQNGPDRAVLTVGYSAERKDLFKWAGPTTQGIYGIFENGDSGINYPLDIEKAKGVGSIAVVRNWLETTTLEKLGFQNLVYYDTYEEALSAFMNGSPKFIASDFFHLVKTLPAGYFMGNVSTVTRYHTVFNYIAFSKDVSDDIVERVQNAINSMIEDQTTASVLRKCFATMPADYIPGTVQLFTEVSPPLNYGTGVADSRKVEGSSVDIVNEIQARTKSGYINKTNLSTWVDAYTIPQYLPNSAVYTTARTPEREAMFQWVGPISTNRTYFYTVANSGITIETLEQAKALQSIATPKNWYTHEFLVKNNFGNVVATALTSQEAFDQLVNGEVEGLLMPVLDMKWLAEKNGISMSQLAQSMEVMNYDGYIAFSLNTPSSTVAEWQKNLDEMKADGTFETIWNKWYH
jgi:polar amino acid transport system substrate-binding protein